MASSSSSSSVHAVAGESTEGAWTRADAASLAGRVRDLVAKLSSDKFDVRDTLPQSPAITARDVERYNGVVLRLDSSCAQQYFVNLHEAKTNVDTRRQIAEVCVPDTLQQIDLLYAMEKERLPPPDHEQHAALSASFLKLRTHAMTIDGMLHLRIFESEMDPGCVGHDASYAPALILAVPTCAYSVPNSIVDMLAPLVSNALGCLGLAAWAKATFPDVASREAMMANAPPSKEQLVAAIQDMGLVAEYVYDMPARGDLFVMLLRVRRRATLPAACKARLFTAQTRTKEKYKSNRAFVLRLEKEDTTRVRAALCERARDAPSYALAKIRQRFQEFIASEMAAAAAAAVVPEAETSNPPAEQPRETPSPPQ